MAIARQHDKLDAHAYMCALAEDLKSPLTRIAYQAESAGDNTLAFASIEQTARNALQMLDAFLLGMRGTQQLSLQLAPVSAAAVLNDVAYSLKDIAKEFSCDVHIESHRHTATVVTHREALQVAMNAVGQAFISAQTPGESATIQLASYGTKKGITVGVFSEALHDTLNTRMLRYARDNSGRATRAFTQFSSGISTQLFIADQLAVALNTTMRVASRAGVKGLAFDLVPVSQLTLV